MWLPDTGLKTPEDLAKELAAALEGLYGKPWQVTAATKQPRTETAAETEARLKQEAITAASQHKDVRRALEAFDGAQVVDVKNQN